MALSPEDISQLIEALKPTVQAMIDQANVMGASPDLDDFEGGEDDEALGGSVLPSEGTAPDDGAGGMPGMDDPMGGGLPGGDGLEDLPPGAGEPDLGGDPAGGMDMGGLPDLDGDGDPDLPIEDDEDKAYAKGLYARFAKLMKQGGEEAMKYMGGLGMDDQQLFRKYMKYECDDAEMKERYEKMDEGQMADGDGFPANTEEQFRYHKGQQGMNETAEHYKKKNVEISAKYRKLEGEHNALRQRYNKLEEQNKRLLYAKRKAERREKLHDLQMQGYIFDLDDETADVLPLSDEQFESHCHGIVAKYQKAPIGTPALPVEQETHMAFVKREKAEKYSKDARDICLRSRLKGKELDYKAVRENIERNGGNFMPEQLATV